MAWSAVLIPFCRIWFFSFCRYLCFSLSNDAYQLFTPGLDAHYRAQGITAKGLFKLAMVMMTMLRMKMLLMMRLFYLVLSWRWRNHSLGSRFWSHSESTPVLLRMPGRHATGWPKTHHWENARKNIFEDRAFVSMNKRQSQTLLHSPCRYHIFALYKHGYSRMGIFADICLILEALYSLAKFKWEQSISDSTLLYQRIFASLSYLFFFRERGRAHFFSSDQKREFREIIGYRK